MDTRKRGYLLCSIITVCLIAQVVSIEGTYHDQGNILTTCLSTNNPLLASSFLGGSNKDGMYYTDVNIIQDPQGNIFIAGTTESTDFPVTLNAYSPSSHGNRDVFVTKMDSRVTTILASTYIGGSNNEEARGIQIDENGDIYICGITQSSDFPVTAEAYQQTYHGGTPSPYGSGDAFVVKFNNDLTEVIASTFLGGIGHDFCNAIDLDSYGNVVITGGTSSADFPMTASAYDRTYHVGGSFGDDIYIAKFSSDLSTLLASTYLGGTQDDASEGIIVDAFDRIYVAGWIRSSDFPTTETAFTRTFGGGIYDGFVSGFDNNLTELQASTFIGGSQWDFCYGITLDTTNNIYVTGHTASRNYPVSPTAFCTSYQGLGGPDQGDDVFVSKFNSNLTMLTASTFLGGDNWEIGYTVGVSQSKLIYVGGTTSSSDFPITPNAFSSLYHGGTKYTGDVFLCCLTAELSVLASSFYLGAAGDDSSGQLIFDSTGNVVISGSTASETFPVSDGCYDSTYNGMKDVFLSRFDPSLSFNNPPDKPVISGPPSGKSGQVYEYTAVTNDTEHHLLYYQFDWDDGAYSPWLGPFVSGERCFENHTWSEKGEYQIKVKTKDLFNAESAWSDPLPITMPYTYIKSRSAVVELVFKLLLNAFQCYSHYNSINNFSSTFIDLKNLNYLSRGDHFKGRISL